MKILHVARRFTANAWGGTESVVAALVREQLKCGDSARLHCTSALDAPGTETLMGVDLVRHRYGYTRFPLSARMRAALDCKGGNPLALGMWWALLNEPGLDVIHCHTMQRLAGQVRWVARRRNLPYVVQLHGGEFAVPTAEKQEMHQKSNFSLDWGKVPSALLGTRGFLRDANLVLVLSKEELERGRQLYPDTRIEELPNGVDPSWLKQGDRARGRQALALPDGVKMALTVARIDPQKGQEMIPAVLARSKNLHAVLVGPVTVPGYDEKILQRAEAAGVLDRLHMAGSMKPESRELADVFAAADLFVLPSRHEPFGIVALEAWAAGLPVVATKVGGLGDLVHDGREGLLVSSGDESGLAAAVSSLIDDPRHAKALGETGLNRVNEEFSWRAVSDRLRALYNEIGGCP